MLKGAGLLDRNRWSPSKKGKGFAQPLEAHEHWHIDISYLNLAGTFCFLCPVLDGYSRDSKLEAARAKRLGAKSFAAEQANTHTVIM